MTLRQLCEKYGHRYVIPAYQRRYVWGQTANKQNDAVQYLMACLLDAYAAGHGYFLQGITLCGSERDSRQLVDGQQRITFMALLLKYLIGDFSMLSIDYACRPQARDFFLGKESEGDAPTQDIYYFRKSLATISLMLDQRGIDRADFLKYLLDGVEFVVITIDNADEAIATFKMMNGTKGQMLAPDIIKADIMRLASDPTQPQCTEWEINTLRSAYASEWEEWMRWWSDADNHRYFCQALEGANPNLDVHPLDLLLRLALRSSDSDLSQPVSYDEFRHYIYSQDTKPYHAAKHFFLKARLIQKRCEEALDDPVAYNRIMAVLLLQQDTDKYAFLYHYMVNKSIDAAMLERCYKLSFLGMPLQEILDGADSEEYFSEVLASLSQADVYHTDAKREAFNLLLRLNIDEDIKLKRRFDFSIWNNRSLEHIYSKSKVWHRGDDGYCYDGNDNQLHQSAQTLHSDASFMPRDLIVNHDGMQLSEHCIGNLVLLYGLNNASFGNANFDQKKMMFLAPGDMGVFQSRNLLHSIFVFAGNRWDHQSIIDNYNLTLKNLKLYYGFK